jgi:hypothetical protein
VVVKLVTLDQAKAHLYVDSDGADEDIEAKIEEASAAVVTYLGAGATFLDSSGLPNGEIPYQVRAATLQLLTALYENRGDDGGTLSQFMQGYLPPVVTALLYPLRDPALA